MSWGKGITITLIIFIFFILSFVYKSTQQDFDLVTKNYYEESLVYDEVQTKRSNFQNLNTPINIELNKENETLALLLPSFFDEKPIKGQLHLYCPKDDSQDLVIDFKVLNPQISLKNLTKGLWRLIVDWESEQKGYRYEQSIVI